MGVTQIIPGTGAGLILTLSPVMMVLSVCGMEYSSWLDVSGMWKVRANNDYDNEIE